MCGAGASVEVLCCVVALVHKCRGASKQVCEDLQTILQTSLRILNKDAMYEGHWIQRNSDSRIAFDGDLRVHIQPVFSYKIQNSKFFSGTCMEI